MLKDKNKGITNIVVSKEGIISFDYDLGFRIGAGSLKEITEDDKFIYETLDFENVDGKVVCNYATYILDKPYDITTLYMLYPDFGCPFNQQILAYLIKNNKKNLLNKARELKVEVYGERYKNTPSYRNGEPFAKIDEAILIEETLLLTDDNYATQVDQISKHITFLTINSASKILRNR